MNKICNIVIRKILLLANIYEEDEQIEVYVYGLLSFIYTVLPICILLTIAYIFNSVFDICIWTIYFLTLRKFAGGYHAAHPITCFLYTVALGSSSIVFTKWKCVIHPAVYISITVFTLIYFFIFSPITHKKFSKKIRFLCKLRLCVILLFSTYFFSIFSNYEIVFLHAVLCTLFLCIAEQIHKCYHSFMEESL